MNSTTSFGGTFAAAFRDAIRARQVSLTWLHQRLTDRASPVSMATLSYWRSGSRQPEGAASLAAVDEIEALLGLAPGALSRSITPAPRIGAVSVAHVPNEEEIAQAIEEITVALGATPQSDLRDLSTLVIADAGPDGDLRSVTLRTLVQSTASVMSSIPLFDFVTSPGAAPKELVDVRGGRFAPTYRHRDGRVVCDLLELDKPIPPGGTTMIEYTELYPTGYPDARSVTHTVSRPARQTMIWARFHPDAVPDWCEEFVEVDGDETVQLHDVSDAGAVHAFRFGFGPATLGVRWGFDEDPRASSIQPGAVAWR